MAFDGGWDGAAAGGGGGGSPPSLDNLAPLPGQLARWTKVTGQMLMTPGRAPSVLVKVGSDPHVWHSVFQDGEFAPLFAPHSAVVVNLGGGAGGTDLYTFSVLPAGGWWGTPVEISWGEFLEAVEI